MSEAELTGMTAAILATNGFEELELLEPRDALDHAGAITGHRSEGRKSARDEDAEKARKLMLT